MDKKLNKALTKLVKTLTFGIGLQIAAHLTSGFVRELGTVMGLKKKSERTGEPFYDTVMEHYYGVSPTKKVDKEPVGFKYD